MKKVYILILCLIAKVGFSQTLVPVHSGDTISFSGPDNTSYSSNVEIRNTGLTALNVLVQRISESMAVNHSTFFCWAECYSDSTSLSPVPILLQPGESTPNFQGHVNPHAVAGQDTVNYALFGENGTSDTLYLTCTYNFIHDGIDEVSTSKNFLSIFVNENKTASVNYLCNSLSNSKIQISNMLGKVVKEIKIEDKAATIKIPVGELAQGVYFCGLNTDGKFVATKKFIIAQ